MVGEIGKMHGKPMKERVVFNLLLSPAPASKPSGACFGSSYLLGLKYNNLNQISLPKGNAVENPQQEFVIPLGPLMAVGLPSSSPAILDQRP